MVPLLPEERFALLRLCAVPRFTFVARVHPPTVVDAAAAIFDARILEHFCLLADCSPLDSSTALDALYIALIGLPLAEGGMGLRSIRASAALAYAASVDPASDAQKVRQAAADAATLTELCRHKRFKKILAAAKPRSTLLPFLPPTMDTAPWGEGTFAIAVQSRCGMLHRATCFASAIGTKTGMECACGIISLVEDWHEHVKGCCKRPGYGPSSRAKAMNDLVHGTLAINAPELCPQLLPPATADGSSEGDLSVLFAAGPLLLDWVVFSPLAKSAPSVRRSEQRKTRRYKDADVAVVGCAVSSGGALSASTLRVLRCLESACHVPIVPAFVRCVVASTASIIRDARFRAGLLAPRREHSASPLPRLGLTIDDLPPVAYDDELSDEAHTSTPGQEGPIATPHDQETAEEEAEEEEDEEEYEDEEEDAENEEEEDKRKNDEEEKAIEVEDNELGGQSEISQNLRFNLRISEF
jgi:hypothetical protein